MVTIRSEQFHQEQDAAVLLSKKPRIVAREPDRSVDRRAFCSPSSMKRVIRAPLNNYLRIINSYYSLFALLYSRFPVDIFVDFVCNFFFFIPASEITFRHPNIWFWWLRSGGGGVVSV